MKKLKKVQGPKGCRAIEREREREREYADRIYGSLAFYFKARF
jgi:hypothetical protein